jgi:PadR family transcriptional regulator, regulatory protein PadR
MRRVRKLSAQTIAVILALADETAGWSHGYDLCRRLDLKAGTVYPILMRLAERGQVETTWETDPPAGRPARHLYRLSDAGTELADELRAAAVAEGPRGRSADSPRLAIGEVW